MMVPRIHRPHLLVGVLEHVLFFIIYGIILPIDYIMFFKMVKTTNQPQSIQFLGEIGLPTLGGWSQHIQALGMT